MKTIRKLLFCMISLLVLLVIIISGVRRQEFSPALQFYIETNSGTNEVSLYQAEDGSYYVFLPSYAQMQDVKIRLPSSLTASLDATQLYDEMDCSGFVLGKDYTFLVNGSSSVLRFYRSANVATIYIDTVTGTLEALQSDKDYKETASVSIYTADGTLDYHGVTCTLKGRGNATWDYEKKPYTLTLPTEENLLGMGTASTWVLLANATDETNLNNKLVYDLARQVGLSGSPESSYADVYFDGEYHGLYLLTEKVEVSPERLAIDTDSGDFLCKIDLRERWNTLRNPFLTKSGRTIELCAPKSPALTDLNRIESLVNSMEQALLSGGDLEAASNIDIDSWVRRYLIDEISGNIDADLASSYFYYSDGVFYAGPVWDYDRTFGNSHRNENPHSFIAKIDQKAENYLSPYYKALYENSSFHDRMTEIYRTEFLPLLTQLAEFGISDLATEISSASEMNSIRWSSMFQYLYGWQVIPMTAETVTEYLRSRIQFLNSAWLEETDYRTLQFELSQGGFYWNISVATGDLLETSYVDIKNTTWIDSETGAAYDFSQPVTKDKILTLQDTQSAEQSTEASSGASRSVTSYIVFLSITVLFIAFLLLTSVDRSHRRKEQKNAALSKK